MRLRRPYIDRVLPMAFGLFLVAGAVAAVVEGVRGRIRHVPPALIALLIGGWLVWAAVGRFRVDVDADGWSVRTRALTRDLRWDDLAAVVLADAPVVGHRLGRPGAQLLLVPANGVDLGVPLPESSPVDG